MNILFISDTHSYHRELLIPEGIDMIIHSGDSTNYRELYKNEIEFEDFLNWYCKIPVKYKLLCAGNHDAWATKKYNIQRLKESGIIYLEHDYINIEGLKIFMSPYTPTFGDWYFNINRAKINRYWENLDSDIDIFVCHGPCRGILDLSIDKNRILEYCGDGSLTKHIFKTKPLIFASGHIHDSDGCFNYGVRKLDSYYKTTFINSAMVRDRHFSKGLIHQGIVVEVNTENKQIKNIKIL